KKSGKKMEKWQFFILLFFELFLTATFFAYYQTRTVPTCPTLHAPLLPLKPNSSPPNLIRAPPQLPGTTPQELNKAFYSTPKPIFVNNRTFHDLMSMKTNYDKNSNSTKFGVTIIVSLYRKTVDQLEKWMNAIDAQTVPIEEVWFSIFSSPN